MIEVKAHVQRAEHFLFSVLLVFAVALPAAVQAQFRQPTDEELKMTDRSQGSGQAASRLLSTSKRSTNDDVHFRSYYARIKVLTEKGKELATIDIPYYSTDSKITDIKGRTIHPDGTVIPLVVKPEDLLIAKSGENQIKHRVFNLPSVEVGSILEYRFDLNYDDNLYSSPTWEVQRQYFVHQAHYAFTPYKGFLRGLDNITTNFLEDEHGTRDQRRLICVAESAAKTWPPLKIDACRPQESGREQYSCRPR